MEKDKHQIMHLVELTFLCQTLKNTEKLLYTGESENVHDRIVNHDRLEDWKKELLGNETLCYSFGAIGSGDRVRAEAALIFKHKPPMNEEYTHNFPYEDTEMVLTGETTF